MLKESRYCLSSVAISVQAQAKRNIGLMKSSEWEMEVRMETREKTNTLITSNLNKQTTAHFVFSFISMNDYCKNILLK